MTALNIRQESVEANQKNMQDITFIKNEVSVNKILTRTGDVTC